MADLIDFSRIRETSDGDIEFEVELIEMYLDDAQIHINNLQLGITASDALAVKQAAHTLKGSSANIGAVGVQRAALTLEKTGAAGNLQDAGTDLETLREVFTQTSRAFLDYVAQVNP